jgi:hypothetical protein
MHVLIDTGSSDFWVFSDECVGCKKKIEKFDCNNSSTCVETNNSFNIMYDDGPVNGNIAFDDIIFYPNITIK